MLSERSKLSLCQLLELQDRNVLNVLLGKHGRSMDGISPGAFTRMRDPLSAITTFVLSARPEQVGSLLEEILRTPGDFRTRVSPRYRYDERYDDLVLCLRLDGYAVREQRLVALEPTIDSAEPIEDDLTSEIRRSSLPEAGGILGSMNASTEAFRREPRDYNGCLTKARIALQTLATAIAKARRPDHPGSFNEERWGEVLKYLRTTGLITSQEEKGLAGVFTFVSPGAHRPLGRDEEETARLGRSLAFTMCYFLVRQYNQQCGA